MSTIHAPSKSRVTLKDSKSLYVELTGTASDLAPVVFVHGLGGNSTNWGTLIDVSGLAKQRLVLVFDLEGHGLSPLQTTDISINGYADSLASVMDSAGIQSAVIVGHSMGALIAATFVVKHANRVEKLVLIGPAIIRSFTDASTKAIEARAENVRMNGMSATADAISTIGMSRKSLAERPLAKETVRASLLSASLSGYALACLAITKARDPDYALIVAPTLILAGAEDKPCPESTVTFLGDTIPGAKAVTLQDVGHWPMIEAVEATAKDLNAFIA
ncbi:alpha beta-hydrolase [Coniophora puteana RWD-64-598 SS2]|uniref:Alpha beta-hydrolase n=1 Tax=Coniophora puteana (strain RWD-64-598) TaxID=741705 RepID=A0A5M3MM36_CONPW|nr:alpha beta-hydrolase [Coniophora puteana RWD-64-598 SS2]EIW80238.1 alpha beta-hydrolase [Coniophora puteana RWD-64-598 SS2]